MSSWPVRWFHHCCSRDGYKGKKKQSEPFRHTFLSSFGLGPFLLLCIGGGGWKDGKLPSHGQGKEPFTLESHTSVFLAEN